VTTLCDPGSIDAKRGEGDAMETRLRRSAAAGVFAALLCSCAPAVYSVYQTANMSPQQLAEIDDVTLCDSAIPVGIYRPRPEIVREVQRRGVDCSKYVSRTQSPVTYTPKPTPPPAVLCSTSSDGRTTVCQPM
jgi:hypothetical protein